MHKYITGIALIALATAYLAIYLVGVVTGTRLPFVDDTLAIFGSWAIGALGFHLLERPEAENRFVFAVFLTIPLLFAVGPGPLWLRLVGGLALIAGIVVLLWSSFSRRKVGLTSKPEDDFS